MTEPSPIAVVDAHHHVWDLGVRDQPWTDGLEPLRRSFSLDDLRPAARRGNVTATVLVQTITVPEETPEFLALAAAEPLVAGVVGWTPLDSPEVRFVLDHAGNPPVDLLAGEAWRRDVTELSRSENVTVKLSGLVTRGYPQRVQPDPLRSWARTLLETFGPGRTANSPWLCADQSELLWPGRPPEELDSIHVGKATHLPARMSVSIMRPGGQAASRRWRTRWR